MKKLMFTLVTMLFGVAPTMTECIADIPDNSIYTADAKAVAGKQFTLSFQLRNSADVEAVGLYLRLPEGFSVAKGEGDNLNSAMNADRNASHNLKVYGPHATGEYRIAILNPSSGSVLVGHAGEIFTVTVDVAETVASGTYNVKLEQVELSCLGKIVSENGTYTGKIAVGDPTAVKETVAGTASEVEIYDINGIRQPALRSGINILKDVNGGKARAVTVR